MSSESKRAKNNPTPSWRLGDSSIHQQGLFARVDIRAGERVIEYTGELVDADEFLERSNALWESASEKGDGTVYMFQLSKKRYIDGNVEGNTARLINYSCVPNCETDVGKKRVWIRAMRDIKAGEELSYDYGFSAKFYADNPCRCGSRYCVGYIVTQAYWPKLQKKLKARWKKAKRKGKKNKASWLKADWLRVKLVRKALSEEWAE